VTLNYQHLRCFWVIAEEGTMTRAGARLRVTHSTLSVQLRALEDELGAELFERRGRRLVLTPFGDEIRTYAAEIFRVGRELEDAARRGTKGTALLRVGTPASLPKTIVVRLLEPALEGGACSIELHQGALDGLLEGLAAGRLHVVLADQSPPQGSALRLHAHPLGETELQIYGTQTVIDRLDGTFPELLDGAPMLLPRSGLLRRRIDAWLGERGLHARVVAEIEDAGTLRAFGLRGHGLFPVRVALASEIADVGGAKRVGKLDGLRERYVAITRDRTVRHPATAKMIERARDRLEPG